MRLQSSSVPTSINLAVLISTNQLIAVLAFRRIPDQLTHIIMYHQILRSTTWRLEPNKNLFDHLQMGIPRLHHRGPTPAAYRPGPQDVEQLNVGYKARMPQEQLIRLDERVDVVRKAIIRVVVQIDFRVDAERLQRDQGGQDGLPLDGLKGPPPPFAPKVVAGHEAGTVAELELLQRRPVAREDEVEEAVQGPLVRVLERGLDVIDDEPLEPGVGREVVAERPAYFGRDECLETGLRRPESVPDECGDCERAMGEHGLDVEILKIAEWGNGGFGWPYDEVVGEGPLDSQGR